MRSNEHTIRRALPGVVFLIAIILHGCGDQRPQGEDDLEALDMSSPGGDEDLTSSPPGDDMTPPLDAAPDASVEDADASMPRDPVEPALPELTPPGGSATVNFSSDAPFLQFADGLELATLRRASLGRELFVANWTPKGPGSREALDGLGPLFIVDSCATCHPASGQPPTLHPNGSIGPGILLRLAQQQDDQDTWLADPIYGGQLQSSSTAGMRFEGSVRWSSQITAEGLQQLHYTITTPGHGPLSPTTSSGARRSPNLIGMGLLDAVPDATLHQLADPDDLDQDGISGRVHEVWDVASQTHRPGRFGWKALHSSLLQQSAGAFSEDMGLTSSLFPHSICTAAQTGCLPEEEDAPDVSQSALEAVDRFLASLGVPARDIPDQQKFDAGRARFHDLGCAACHTPSLTTSPDAEPSTFASQRFWPYTDLLLHDMGEALADIPEQGASASEWRTPPLWGLRFIAAQPGGRFLHDGRARNLHEAILWHGGEALAAQRRYKSLSPAQRDELIAFLLGI